MRSIAIFPCSFTYGASVIGELSTILRLQVYTDEMLFSDVSQQFGIPIEEIRTTICGPIRELHRNLLKKNRYVNLLKCTLDAQSMHCSKGQLYYGMHTTLLEIKKDRILTILVVDSEINRVKRAMGQEGITEKVARELVRKHDKKVFQWTNFLVEKAPYDHSLYDLVISVNNKKQLDIVADIVKFYTDFAVADTQHALQVTAAVSEIQMSCVV